MASTDGGAGRHAQQQGACSCPACLPCRSPYEPPQRHSPAPTPTCAAAWQRAGCQTPPPSAVRQHLDSAPPAWLRHKGYCWRQRWCHRWLLWSLLHHSLGLLLPAGSRARRPGGFPAQRRQPTRQPRLQAAAAAQKGMPGAGRGWRCRQGRHCRAGWSRHRQPAAGGGRGQGKGASQCPALAARTAAANLGRACRSQP